MSCCIKWSSRCWKKYFTWKYRMDFWFFYESFYLNWWKLLTTQPLEAFNVTALLVFIVDSRNFAALTSQNTMFPPPLPMVRIFPLNETDRILEPLFLDGIFFIAYYQKKNQVTFFKVHEKKSHFIIFFVILIFIFSISTKKCYCMIFFREIDIYFFNFTKKIMYLKCSCI